MFTSIEHFKQTWKHETGETLRLFDKLTDSSLSQPQIENIRTIGRAVWHIVTTYPEMCGRIGIRLNTPTDKDAIPGTVAKIKEAYQEAVNGVYEQVSQWSDDDLQIEDDLYGETWKRGKSLWVFLVHEIHHRGQLTILMRLAGLPVVGVYGPAKEEWAGYGAPPPEV